MKKKVSASNVICALLGFLGTAVSLVLGLYLISTLANLSSIQDETGLIWIAGVTTAATAITTAYGSYRILDDNMRKGGTINIIGGAIFVATYVYFSAFSQPNLLRWLSPSGITLLIPPLLSGVISLISNSK
jgi:hypothetical protein